MSNDEQGRPHDVELPTRSDGGPPADSTNINNATPPYKRLGDFELLREIGRGGMGVVYEAQQISLKRRVALKVLPPGLGLTTQAVQRFEREAQAAAKLHHTNIVPVYATGQDQGCHYYAMELVQGPSLARVLNDLRGEKSNPLMEATVTQVAGDSHETGASAPGRGEEPTSPSDTGSRQWFDTVAKLLVDVGNALQYAHDQGVIHRDVKPANLLLAGDGRLCLGDFGLARVAQEPGMTVSGSFLGTPAYMSPEQVAAGRVKLDHRTDVYSLGAVLYEMLTLQRPFPGDSRDQVLTGILSKEPKPPRRVNPRVPVDLETICLKAMEKDPDRRYSTAGEMVADLRQYLQRGLITARRAGPLTRMVKLVRRRPVPAAMAAVVVVVSLVAGILGYHGYRSSRQLGEMQQQQALDDAMLAAMGGDFERAEAAIERAGSLGASEGRIRMLRGQVDLYRGRGRESIEHLEQSVRLMSESIAAKAMLAQALLQDGRIEGYYALLDEIIDATPSNAEDQLFLGWAMSEYDLPLAARLLDEAVGRRDSALARLLRGEAKMKLAMYSGRTEHAESALEDATVARSLLPENPAASVLDLFTHLVAANTYRDAGQEQRRETSLAKARRTAEDLSAFPGHAAAHRARMVYFDQTGDFDSAFEEALLAGRTLTVGFGLYDMGRYEEAVGAFDLLLEGGRDFVMETARAYVLVELQDGHERARDAARQLMDCWNPTLPASVLLLLGSRAELLESCPRLRSNASRMTAWRVIEMDYLCGEATESALLSTAERFHKGGEAHFLIALDHLAVGDRITAAEHFREALHPSAFLDFFWQWNRLFLERLEEEPSWPPWIPQRRQAVAEPRGAN